MSNHPGRGGASGTLKSSVRSGLLGPDYQTNHPGRKNEFWSRVGQKGLNRKKVDHVSTKKKLALVSEDRKQSENNNWNTEKNETTLRGFVGTVTWVTALRLSEFCAYKYVSLITPCNQCE